ncbi:sensor histidine kinase [Atopomonas sediminilitoris]|uniref:sensor histidine kinase n=1 Tax=Atopomonas sediminilitoris TaxID=2919919 RepID=UPI001F4E0FB7|nr:histidine kinase [Atopomonas sediminilitoris]MCJ8170517.1 histidine kinase [Atopomonas sediminilitoris]
MASQDAGANNQRSPFFSEEDDFFVPSLCTSEAVFTLVVMAELLVLVLVLAEPMEAGFDWVRLALTSLFVQWNVLLSAALLCALRPRLARLDARTAALMCVALVVVLTLMCTLAAETLRLFVVLPDSEGNLRYLRNGLISLIMSTLVLRYFWLQSQWRIQQQAELRARIQSLQARIRPHFLFNSLNSIASLVAVDADKAEQAVLDLSDLFRASLATPGTLVRWREELDLCQRYLSIEHYRLGDRLQMCWDVAAIPDDLPIPQLSLQPLLENALIYGIQPRIEGGEVVVTGAWDGQLLRLEVSNPCAEHEVVESTGTHLALENIQARLKVLFGSEAAISAQRRAGRYIATLSYPCSRLMPEA